VFILAFAVGHFQPRPQGLRSPGDEVGAFLPLGLNRVKVRTKLRLFCCLLTGVLWTGFHSRQKNQSQQKNAIVIFLAWNMLLPAGLLS